MLGGRKSGRAYETPVTLARVPEGFIAELTFGENVDWYRNIELSWELMAPWQGAVVTPPALYVAGDRDLVVNFPGVRERLPDLKKFAPNLEPVMLLPGCGHWTQQERPAEVNAALLGFLGK